MHRRLATDGLPKRAGDAALEAFDCGAMVVDAAMRLLHANAAAERMVIPRHGLRLHSAHGRGGGKVLVHATHRATDTRLQQLVRSVAREGLPGGALMLPAPDAVLHAGDAGAALALLICPLPAMVAGRDGGMVPGRALILVRRLGSRAAPDGRLLGELFGLTPSEVEVARLLALGSTAEAIAVQRKVSLATIRTQIRAMLTKSGAVSLRDFQRILALLPQASR